MTLARAALLLSVGEVSDASKFLADADGLLASSPAASRRSLSAVASALESLIHLARNETDSAASTAAKAAELDPSSPAAHVAHSLAAQARFKLDDAESSLRRAVELEPSYAYARARLAEIVLGSGRDGEAASEISEALAVDPKSAYALAVRGFTQLIRGDARGAADTFAAAAAADSALALPRLGLGLAKMRLGDVEGGRREMEHAVYLEPNQAQYRSYLGKAYYEEERGNLAEEEYGRAIALDPQDPTPHLYRAFNRLSRNDPIGALRDVERSIDLNDNRAVYRSKLLLDQDQSVRSANLAQVFTNLGFEEAARVEALKSLNRDYGNYSAHLLLSESYRSILLNDARRSERKIAELLSPPSINLLQEGGGRASLNDYNALFDRAQGRTSISAVAQTFNDVVAPSASYARKGENYAYSVRGGSTMTDGSRDNDFARFNDGAVNFIYQPTADDRLHLAAESGHARERNNRDLFPEEEFDRYSFSAGYFRRLGPGSSIVGRLEYSDNRNRLETPSFTETAVINAIENGEAELLDNDIEYATVRRESVNLLRPEAQYQLDTEAISLVAGAKYSSADVDRRDRGPILWDERGIFDGVGYEVNSRGRSSLDSGGVYSYLTAHPFTMVDITFGGSWDRVERERSENIPFLKGTRTETRFNPKAGISVYPLDGLTLRGAYFETLRKPALEDAVDLEPTFVSGFNQRFTDLSGARARSYGLGFDYKIAASTYLGAEAFHRDLIKGSDRGFRSITVDYDELTIAGDTDSIGNYDSHNNHDRLKGYFYHVFSDRLVGALDYERWKLERTDRNPDGEGYQDVKLDRARAAFRYFMDSGFFPFVEATWRHQDRLGGDFLPDGTETFTIVDVGLGYRLPNRHGSIVLKAANVFDKQFVYDQSFGLEEYIAPGIGGILLASVNF